MFGVLCKGLAVLQLHSGGLIIYLVSPDDYLWTLEKILGILTVSHFSLNRSVTVSVDRRDSYSFFCP